MFVMAAQNEQPIFNIKLCAAIKKNKILYDHKLALMKNMPEECEPAWKDVAEECGESVENCRWRWKHMHKSFSRSLRTKKRYYLHEHMTFLIPTIRGNKDQGNENTYENPEETKGDINVSNTEIMAQVEKNNENKNEKLNVAEEKNIKNENDKISVGEDKNTESDSDTTSADESHILKTFNDKQNDPLKVLPTYNEIQSQDGTHVSVAVGETPIEVTNEAGDFIINEIDECGVNNNEDDMDMDSAENIRSRLRYRRACKRGLDAELVNELTSNDMIQEEKRPRRSAERRKTLVALALEEFNKRKSLPNLLHKKNMEEKVIKSTPYKNIIKNVNEIEPEPENVDMPVLVNQNLYQTTNYAKPKMVDSYTIMDVQTTDSSTQYDTETQDYDDTFIESLKPQLKLMNGRQKMNFKRKIFQSIMEVFDDASNFPNVSEFVVLPPNGAPRFDATTSGELRLMRELVALVHAAKHTPEIINATEKVINPVIEKPSTPEVPKPSSPMVTSPILDDDDLSFTTEPFNDDDDTPLPRSLDEILVRRDDDDVLGLPRRVIHKVVKVVGANGSTIVTGEGNKRRVYRIYPKNANPEANRDALTKNFGSTSKFYITPSKTASSTTKSANQSLPNKPNTSTPNITFRPVTKTANNPSVTFINANKSATNSSGNNKPNTSTGNAPHILNHSTGLFMSPSVPSKASPSNNKPFKSPMLPTGSSTNNKIVNNNSAGRIINIKNHINTGNVTKSQNLVMQRRYSICGPTLSPSSPVPILQRIQPKPNIQPTSSTPNGNSIKSPVAQIQLSKPVSLNPAANAAISSNTKLATAANATISSNTKLPTAANSTNNNNVRTVISNPYKVTSTTPSNNIPQTNNVVEPSRPSPKQTPPTNTPTSSNKPFEPAKATQQPPEIPILQTAGTISADPLFADPLFDKPEIKLEPLD